MSVNMSDKGCVWNVPILHPYFLADLVKALELLQLRAQLDAIVLLALQSFLQGLSLLPLNTQIVLQTKPEKRCSHTAH